MFLSRSLSISSPFSFLFATKVKSNWFGCQVTNYQLLSFDMWITNQICIIEYFQKSTQYRISWYHIDFTRYELIVILTKFLSPWFSHLLFVGMFFFLFGWFSCFNWIFYSKMFNLKCCGNRKCKTTKMKNLYRNNEKPGKNVSFFFPPSTRNSFISNATQNFTWRKKIDRQKKKGQKKGYFGT